MKVEGGINKTRKQNGISGGNTTTEKESSNAHVTEASTHDDGLVAMLFVIIEDLLDRYDTWVLVPFIISSCGLFVIIEDL